MLLEPVKRLVGIYNIFQQALGASQKVFEYLDHQETVVEPPGAPALDRLRAATSRSRTSPSTIPARPTASAFRA